MFSYAALSQIHAKVERQIRKALKKAGYNGFYIVETIKDKVSPLDHYKAHCSTQFAKQHNSWFTVVFEADIIGKCVQNFKIISHSNIPE